MISKTLDYRPVVQGDITIPLTPLIENVLAFIDEYLPLFPASLRAINPTLVTEKLLNQHLSDFFNGHAPDYCSYLLYRFIFRKDDERADIRTRPDIGVTIWHKELHTAAPNSFFQIECKRLPTPNVNVNRRESEYVMGTPLNKGGIERFKRNDHGHHIEQAAIIGYVQSESLEYWQNKIAEWINAEINNTRSDLTWTVDDVLHEIYKTELICKYYSICSRNGNPNPIKLYHLIVNTA